MARDIHLGQDIRLQTLPQLVLSQTRSEAMGRQTMLHSSAKKKLLLGGGLVLQVGYEQCGMGHPNEKFEHRIDTESEDDNKGDDINQHIKYLAEDEEWPAHLRDLQGGSCGLAGGDDFVHTYEQCAKAICICCEDPVSCKKCNVRNCEACLEVHKCTEEATTGSSNDDVIDQGIQEDPPVEPPPAKKHMCTLDDSEGELQDEEQYEDLESGPEQGDQEAPQPKRINLNRKTKQTKPIKDTRRTGRRSITRRRPD